MATTLAAHANPVELRTARQVGAKFLNNPIVSVLVEPEGSGTLSFEGLELAHDDAYQYARIASLDELHQGDRIILAARYDDVANHYVALKNALTTSGSLLSTTAFTSLTEGSNEILPDELEAAYPDNMTMIAVIELDDVELQSEHYELAAFANSECRGSARLMNVEPLNRYIAFLTIVGDGVSELRFSLYDSETGVVETQGFASL